MGSFKEKKILLPRGQRMCVYISFICTMGTHNNHVIKLHHVFPALRINDTFVQHPASIWESESHFDAGQTKDHVLAVVNDPAERAIAFTEKFNTALTTKEEHKQ